jgi:hypothetical protein
MEVDDEKLVADGHGVSGTGPTYVFLVMEALIDAAVHLGFPRHVAHDLVIETLEGSTLFAKSSGMHPAQLRNMVTSPGGTSAAALHELESGGCGRSCRRPCGRPTGGPRSWPAAWRRTRPRTLVEAPAAGQLVATLRCLSPLPALARPYNAGSRADRPAAVALRPTSPARPRSPRRLARVRPRPRPRRRRRRSRCPARPPAHRRSDCLPTAASMAGRAPPSGRPSGARGWRCWASRWASTRDSRWTRCATSPGPTCRGSSSRTTRSSSAGTSRRAGRRPELRRPLAARGAHRPGSRHLRRRAARHTGYASPDWVGFVGEGPPRAYPGLPGTWAGHPVRLRDRRGRRRPAGPARRGRRLPRRRSHIVVGLMRVELLVTPDCPHAEGDRGDPARGADRRRRAGQHRAGATSATSTMPPGSASVARRRSASTARDVVPPPPDTPINLGCRLYRSLTAT